MLIIMTNSETKMILTPRRYTMAQVAQLLNYGESKVRMLIITGQLRSIKDRRSAGFFPSGLRPTFKIAPSRPRTPGDESESQRRGFDPHVRRCADLETSCTDLLLYLPLNGSGPESE